MKKGDLVRCSKEFKFEAVNHEDLLTISVSKTQGNAQVKEYLVIPLYLHGLGFYPPDYDYCLPGSYLPITHPDYYRETKDGFFQFNGEKHKISFDPDFMYTGKYWLIPENGATIIKHAALRSPELRQKRIEDALGQTLDGIMIEGKILDFLVREKGSNELVQIINGKVVSSDHQVGDTSVFAFIQDPVTRVEFQFPVSYLTLKP